MIAKASKELFLNRLKNKLQENGLPEAFKTYKEYKEFIINNYKDISYYQLIEIATNSEATGLIDELEKNFNEKADNIESELRFEENKVSDAMSSKEIKDMESTLNDSLTNKGNFKRKEIGTYLIEKLENDYNALLEFILERPYLIKGFQALNEDNEIVMNKSIKNKITKLLKEYKELEPSIKQQESIDTFQISADNSLQKTKSEVEKVKNNKSDDKSNEQFRINDNINNTENTQTEIGRLSNTSNIRERDENLSYKNEIIEEKSSFITAMKSIKGSTIIQDVVRDGQANLIEKVTEHQLLDEQEETRLTILNIDKQIKLLMKKKNELTDQMHNTSELIMQKTERFEADENPYAEDKTDIQKYSSSSSLVEDNSSQSLEVHDITNKAENDHKEISQLTSIEQQEIQEQQQRVWVNLSHRQIKGDKAVKKLFESFSKNKLISLDLSCNKMCGGAWAKEISEFLINNLTLTYLNLSNNEIGGDFWADELSRALKKNTTLTILDLSHNEICGDFWAKKLFPALQENTTLKILNLSYNQFRGPKWYQKIEEIAKYNPGIEMIVGNNNSTELPFIEGDIYYQVNLHGENYEV